MASRVNTKFVITLAAVLGAVFVLVGATLYVVVRKSGDDYERLGDAKMQAGEYGAAARFYSRAVNHDTSNLVWLGKWRDAILKLSPPSDVEYAAEYNRLLNVTETMARVQGTNVQAHAEFLNIVLANARSGPYSRGAYDFLVSSTDNALRFFVGQNDPKAEWNTLRRYRGIARATTIASGVELPPQESTAALEDLEAALVVRPDDADASNMLSRLHRSLAEQARRRNDPSTEAARRADAQRVAESFAQAYPNNLLGRVGLLEQRAVAASAAALAIPDSARRAVAQRESLAALKGQAEELITLALGADPKDVSPDFIRQFLATGGAIDPQLAVRGTAQLVDRALQARPDDAELMFLRALVSYDLGDRERALREYQAIIDLPRKTISLDGMMQGEIANQAAARQVETALAIWSASGEGTPERERWLKEVEQYFEKVRTRLPERSPQVLLLDARIKTAKRDLSGAQRVLAEFNNLTNSSVPEGLRLMGTIALETNQFGLAEQMFSRLLAISPDNPQGLVGLADTQRLLKNPERALELYNAYLAYVPDDANVIERRKLTEAMLGRGTVDDPATQALVEAQTLLDQGDVPGAEARLAQALAKDAEPRVVVTLARIRLSQGDREGALQAVQAGLAKNPDNRDLKVMSDTLASDDPIGAAIAAIEASDQPAIEKILNRVRLYGGSGNVEKAREELAKAKALAPEDGRVIGLAFDDALTRKDMEEARRQADAAAKQDLDQVGGLAYRARMELTDGRTREALATLQRATEKGTTNTGVWRLLAAVQTQLGRGEDAVVSYRRALEIRPNDLAVILDYMQLLRQLGRDEEALAVARASQQYGRGVPQFVDRWLALEARVGSRADALAERQKILAREPENRVNRAALAALYTDLSRFDEARKLIDELRAQNDSLDLARLDAAWYAAKGDLAQAAQTFVNYITGIERSKLTAEPYLVFGEFMLERDAIDIGLNALEQARPFQDPKVLEADRALADANFKLDRYEPALVYLRGLIEKGVPDPEDRIKKRIVDALVRLGKFEEAEIQAVSVGPAGETDQELLMLRADAANGLKNAARARELVDKAVALSPKDPFVYLKRAAILGAIPEYRKDALADVDTALQLRPDMWQCHRMRGAVLLQMDRENEALESFARAVESAPTQRELRIGIMREFLTRKRSAEAQDLALRLIEKRPTDVEMILELGDRFIERDEWERAARIYAKAWELDKRAAVAERYAEGLLRSTPPDVRTAEAVLATPGLDIDKNPGLLLARAKAAVRGNNIPRARRDATAAFDLIGRSPQGVGAWFGALENVFDKRPEMLAYLAEFERGRGNNEWLRFLKARYLAGDDSTRAQGLQELRAIAGAAEDSGTRLNAIRVLGLTLFSEGEHAEAAEVYRQGLTLAPDDLEFNNNLAYVLAKHLNKPDEALPLAERAVALAPQRMNILDTAGVVYLKLGRLDKAQESFDLALTLPGTPADKAPVRLHLAEVKIAQKDPGSARPLLDQVRASFDLDPNIRKTYEAEYDALRQQVGN